MKKITKKITKKEQARIEKEKRMKELFEKVEQRLAYLRTLGLEKDVMITLSTLKDIFTDKTIEEHFPKPYSTAFNPNLSKSYQKNHPKSKMKLYLMANVIEKIKAGVKPRIKDCLSDEYKKMLFPTLLDLELPKKSEAPRKTNKI